MADNPQVPPPGPDPQPAPVNVGDEKTLALLAHILGIVSGFVGALIIYLIATDKPFAKQQAQEALNFQITLIIGWAASVVLMIVGIGVFLYPLVWVANLVFCIMGAMAVSKGEAYRYPFALRLIK